MIQGIGIDLVSVKRIEKSLEKLGDPFAKKILSDNELSEYSDEKNKAAYLAKHFASKEAFLKALGTGLRNGISFKQISVEHNELGKPLMHCEARAKEIIDDQSITNIHLSISDEKDYATAVVVLEQ